MPALPFDENVEPENAGTYDPTRRVFTAAPRLTSISTKLLSDAVAEFHKSGPGVAATLRGVTVDFSHL
jgi:hypothetical protein